MDILYLLLGVEFWLKIIQMPASGLGTGGGRRVLPQFRLQSGRPGGLNLLLLFDINGVHTEQLNGIII